MPPTLPDNCEDHFYRIERMTPRPNSMGWYDAILRQPVAGHLAKSQLTRVRVIQPTMMSTKSRLVTLLGFIRISGDWYGLACSSTVGSLADLTLEQMSSRIGRNKGSLVVVPQGELAKATCDLYGIVKTPDESKSKETVDGFRRAFGKKLQDLCHRWLAGKVTEAERSKELRLLYAAMKAYGEDKTKAKDKAVSPPPIPNFLKPPPAMPAPKIVTKALLEIAVEVMSEHGQVAEQSAPKSFRPTRPSLALYRTSPRITILPFQWMAVILDCVSPKRSYIGNVSLKTGNGSYTYDCHRSLMTNIVHDIANVASQHGHVWTAGGCTYSREDNVRCLHQ